MPANYKKNHDRKQKRLGLQMKTRVGKKKMEGEKVNEPGHITARGDNLIIIEEPTT